MPKVYPIGIMMADDLYMVELMQTNTPLATMTLAHTDLEAELILDALAALPAKGVTPIFVTDGGSRSQDFCTNLRAIPGLELTSTNTNGLVAQIMQSFAAALRDPTPYVLYMEPNKQWFIENRLKEFLDVARNSFDSAPRPLGVLVAGRTPGSFATYPAAQRQFESETNALLHNVTGFSYDFSYGPRIIATDLLVPLLDIDISVGWGWMSIPIVLAQRVGRSVAEVVLDLPCPIDEREESECEIAYRHTQHMQHQRAINLALELPIKGARVL